MAYEPRVDATLGSNQLVGAYQVDLGAVAAAGDLQAGFDTSEIESRGFSALLVFVDLTWVAATKVTMTVSEAFVDSPVAADWYKTQFVDDTTSPILVGGDASWDKTVGASTKWMFRVPIGGNKAKLSFIGAGATTDSANVRVVGVA